jgi:hypothetical protein
MLLKRRATFARPDFLRREHVVYSTALKSAALSILICVAASGGSVGQIRPSGGPTPSPTGATVYFLDLKDGALIPPKATIRFGLRGMELVRAGVDRPNSGHHHLLIDTELPALNEPIPADFNHLHFGNAQTEAEITLPPGEHTLRLLLGDKDHVPHSPPLMSARIRVRVVEGAAPIADAGVPSLAPSTPGTPTLAPSTPVPPAQAAATGTSNRHPSPANAKVYFVFPADGAQITPTSTLRFGLSGMGVAPAGVDKANTGHHHLLIDAPLPPLGEPIPLDFNHLHFGAGQTEAEVTLPLGAHTLQLLLGDENHMPHDPPVYSQPIKVTVTETGEPARSAERPRSIERSRVSERARSSERSRRSARAPARSRPRSMSPPYQEDEE